MLIGEIGLIGSSKILRGDDVDTKGALVEVYRIFIRKKAVLRAAMMPVPGRKRAKIQIPVQ